MATLSDNFDDNSLDTGKWSKRAGDGFTGTNEEQNQQYEVILTQVNNTEAGIVSVNTFDVTAPAHVQIDIKAEAPPEQWVYIALTQPTDGITNPFTSVDDWYRWGISGASWFAQKEEADVRTTIASGSRGTLPLTYKIDLPASGDEVRFVEGGTEKTSDVTYAHSTRTVFVGWYAFGDDSEDGTFDNFEAAGPAAVSIPVFMNSYRQRRALV